MKNTYMGMNQAWHLGQMATAAYGEGPEGCGQTRSGRQSRHSGVLSNAHPTSRREGCNRPCGQSSDH